MKKTIYIILSICLIASLCACQATPNRTDAGDDTRDGIVDDDHALDGMVEDGRDAGRDDAADGGMFSGNGSNGNSSNGNDGGMFNGNGSNGNGSDGNSSNGNDGGMSDRSGAANGGESGMSDPAHASLSLIHI